jgi:phosphoglycerate kinase
MRPVLPVLSRLLGIEVAFAEDCVGPAAESSVKALPYGGVLLLENTRFHAGETKNDLAFSKQLSALGDVFVNDAFGSSHRAHASVEGVTHYLHAVAGLLLEKEIEFLSNAIENPQRPFVAIMGGAKISDKIAVIERLLQQADQILIGGGMANTFLQAQGVDVAGSLVEAEALDTARELISKAGDKIHLPVDSMIADAFDVGAARKVIDSMVGVPAGWQILDIGPRTIEAFQAVLENAQTIVWNGPMGVFEMQPFAAGTFRIAELCAERAGAGATVIIGGGDSAAAIRQAGLDDKVTHVSTGGGASLEMLEGKVLPGVAALADK